MHDEKGMGVAIFIVLLLLFVISAAGLLWVIVSFSSNDSEKNSLTQGSIADSSEGDVDNFLITQQTNGNGSIICLRDSDCGNDGLFGETFCSASGEILRKNREWKCNDPGTNVSSCSYSDTDEFVQSCEDGCLNGSCSDIEQQEFLEENYNYLRIFYASSQGNGDGSREFPFSVLDFWNVAQPGDALILLDGEYRGHSRMIQTPEGLNGQQNFPITIRAENDGGVGINGEGLNSPVIIRGNWFVVEGINAYDSNFRVVNVLGSNNIVRRVVGWDAAEGNTVIFSVNYGNNNLIEDSAGFGRARKIFDNYQANYTTWRRTWGRWEGTTAPGVKMTYSTAYESRYLTAENIIGTWDAIGLQNCPENLNGKGIFSLDRMFDDKTTHSKILGSIGYLKGNEKLCGIDRVFSLYGVAEFKVENSVAYSGNPNVFPFYLSTIASSGGTVWSPNHYYSIGPNDEFPTTVPVSGEDGNTHYYVSKTAGYSGTIEPNWSFDGWSVQDGSSLVWEDRGLLNNFGRKLTSIGGKNSYKIRWQISDWLEGASVNQVYSGSNVFNSNSGARICNRYVGGVLTNEPLWPWPMEKRIYDAMIQSGRSPINVTAEIIGIFGQIPSNCKN